MSNPNDLWTQCRFPDIAEPYLGALKAAVRHILDTYEVLGIIAAGSIIRGEGHPSSDWDICVVHAKPQRQMIQTFFEGVPTQIFLNPPDKIRQYFVSEAAEGSCITAHMFVTGFVVLDRDPFIEEARQEAHRVIAAGPQVKAEALPMQAYHIASEFENAMDIIEADPPAGLMLLSHTMMRMLQYYFVRHQIFIPRTKDLLKRAREHNPELGRLVDDFYRVNDLAQKIELAGQIADTTIQARGFFESQTPLETVSME
ncbi:MAG: nucleotidyltransferase domain-containing protein [Chloroflexota bacterium]